jgi:hypothetical protein
MSQPNARVQQACMELALNLGCDKYIDHQYCIPFLNYISLWPYSLPIKTIIVGQNPYPQDIYPDYGSALAYDDSRVTRPPGSVRVLAEALYNYAEIPRDDTVNCFRDLWMLLEHGVLAINETVFSRLLPESQKTNSGPMVEAELQCRALQVLISESFAMGQEKIECAAMGISAQMASSLTRESCPNDVVSFKLVSSSNPAAFVSQLRDRESQSITLKNDSVTKILAGIVDIYVNMPPKQDNREDKRYTQNAEALKSAADDVVVTNRSVRAEYSSFVERLKGVNALPEAKATIDDLADALGSLVTAMDRNSTAISSHTISYIMFANAARQFASKNESVATSVSGRSTATPLPHAPSTSSAPAGRGPTRRVVRPGSGNAAAAPPSEPQPTIKEEPDTLDVPKQTEAPPSISPVRRRRVVRGSASRAPSIADTEYTTVDDNKSTMDKPLPGAKITPIEKVHMNSFSMWFSDRVDSTYGQMLETASSEQLATSIVATKVLEYIQKRMREDSSYDAYTELQDDEIYNKDGKQSESTKWCLEYAEKLSK